MQDCCNHRTGSPGSNLSVPPLLGRSWFTGQPGSKPLKLGIRPGPLCRGPKYLCGQQPKPESARFAGAGTPKRIDCTLAFPWRMFAPYLPCCTRSRPISLSGLVVRLLTSARKLPDVVSTSFRGLVSRFTDGSAIHSNCPPARLTYWSVVVSTVETSAESVAAWAAFPDAPRPRSSGS